MDTVAVVDLLKGVPTPWPRLESDAYLMTTGSTAPARGRVPDRAPATGPLGRGADRAVGARRLPARLADRADAGRDVVDTNYTVVAKVPKSVLGPSATAMQGVHGRLRRTAASL
jgi:hypothetical protein